MYTQNPLDSEELIRRLPGLAIVLDGGGLIRYWNHNAEPLTGIAAERLSGTPLLALVQAAEKNHMADRLQETAGTGQAQAEVCLVLKDGALRNYHFWLSALRTAGKIQMLALGHDVTERVQLKSRLRESEARLSEAHAVAHLGSWDLDIASNALHWSDEIYRIFEIDPARFGASYEAFLNAIHPDDLERVNKAYTDSLDSRQPYAIDHRLLMPDGRIKWVHEHGMALYDENWRPLRSIGTVQDITERKKIEWALGERVKEQRCLYLISRLATRPELPEPDMMNETLAPIRSAFQYPEITRVRILHKDHSHEEAGFRTSAWRLASELRVNGTPEGSIEVYYLDERPPAAEGPFLAEERVLLDAVAQILGRLLGARRAEQATRHRLRRVEAQSEVLNSILSSPTLVAGEVTRLASEITERAARVTGVERASVWLFNADETELHCIDLYEKTPARHSAGMVLKEDQFGNEFRALKQKPYVDADDALTDPRTAGYLESYLKPLRITSMLDAVIELSGHHLGLVCLEHVNQPHHWEEDEISFAHQLATKLALSIITRDRLQAERKLERSMRALKTLSAGNHALVHITEEQALYDEMCRVAVADGGYRMAWIGLAEHDSAKTVRPVAWAGSNGDYVWQAHISWADTERGHGPTGTAIRDGTPVINQDFAHNPQLAPWREQALKHGFGSSVALPLKAGAVTFGAFMIYAAEPDAFGSDEMALLTEMAGDLAFGIGTLRLRKAHEENVLRLGKSMASTIAAIANTVESRDPYTAGHMRRVAELCVAIARQLKLPEDRIQGLRLAANVHDIGKIHIPAEILSKPGQLSRVEFELIKDHPQSGHDIVRDVDFPWPIADMILQHHERLDGSGYPLGLKSEQILLESKILAVADVVEAMMTHRPYRPALGLDVALAELEKGRGKAFDAEAVDAWIPAA